jgi:hypothetical protein
MLAMLAGCAQQAAVMPPAPAQVTTAATAEAGAAGTDRAPIVTCHAPRLDALYRSYWRCTGDHVQPSDSQAEQIRRRLTAQVPPAALKGDGAFAPPPVGTRLYTSLGGYYEILAAEGMTLSIINQAGHISALFAGVFVPWIDSDFDREKLEALWPLEPGKRVQFISTRDRSSWRNEFTVVARERVSTLAGDFDCFRIENQAEALGTSPNRFSIIRKIWYAPAVGYAVKVELEQKSGTPTSERAWELARAVRPLPAAR